MAHAIEDSRGGNESKRVREQTDTGRSHGGSTDSEAGDKHSATEDKLPTSEVFNLLSADRRQEVLRYLDSTDGSADIGELSEHIASIECDCSRSQLSSQERKRVYVGLYQCHLPKMADAGVIEYDPDRGTVALTDRSPRLLEYLYFEEDETSSVRELLGRFLR